MEIGEKMAIAVTDSWKSGLLTFHWKGSLNRRWIYVTSRQFISNWKCPHRFFILPSTFHFKINTFPPKSRLQGNFIQPQNICHAIHTSPYCVFHRLYNHRFGAKQR